MQICTHLSFNGQCKEAFEMYARCLGGEIVFLQTWGESPMGSTFPDLANQVIHATLMVGDQRLTGVDTLASDYRKPQGFTVQVNLTDAAEAERIFATLAEGGAVPLALQKTFWAERYGLVTDRFGTPWEINCGLKPDLG